MPSNVVSSTGTLDTRTKWDAVHMQTEWGADPSEYVIEFCKNHYGNDPHLATRRFLDLGTGIGAQAFYLFESGVLVDAIDSSQAAILRCLWRKRGYRVGIKDGVPTASPLRFKFTACERLNFTLGDVTWLPYSSAIFDAAIDACTFQSISLDEAKTAVAETLRVLKPGGRLISLTAADDYNVEERHGHGPPRLSTSEQVAELYAGFANLIYQKKKHINGSNQEVSWWVVEGRKPEKD